MNRLILVFSFLLAGNVFSANAKELVQALQECKELANAENRLACFDSIQVPAKAIKKVITAKEREVVKEIEVAPTPKQATEVKTVRVIKKEDFGLKNIIKEPEYITLLVDKIKKNPYGDITVYLQEGQVWKQIDGRALRLKKNDKVIIKKGALNSFQMMKEGGSRLVKVKRIK